MKKWFNIGIVVGNIIQNKIFPLFLKSLLLSNGYKLLNNNFGCMRFNNFPKIYKYCF